MIPLFKYFNIDEKSCGSKTFIQAGNNKYTFDEVQEYVTRYSVYFKSQNVNTGDYIGILLESNEDFVFSVLALMNIGAIPVFFNAKNSVAEVSELFNFTGCKYMISRKEFTLPNIILPSKETLNGNIDFHPENITPANTAIIIFTSGSRGTPKAVKITCSNLLNSALASNSIIGYVNGDSWMATLPFYHIGGFSILIRALTFRILLYLPDSLKVSNLKKALDSYNPNHISLVSTQVIKLLEDGYTPTDGLKSVLLGGGFFNNDLIAKLLDKKWPIIKVYGSTESSSLISAHRVKKDDHLPSAGKAVLENKIAVYDKAGDAVPANTEGEIVLSGPVVTNGYLNNMEETARKFRNGCYFSGDYGYLDNDGYLYLVTRREDLIISGGENINPAEIEYLLSKYSPIAEMVVFAEDDKYWGQIPALAVRLRDPKQNITLEEINLFLKDKLASYKFPKKLYIVDEFPKTDLGKVLKKQLISSILEQRAINE